MDLQNLAAAENVWNSLLSTSWTLTAGARSAATDAVDGDRMQREELPPARPPQPA